RGQHPVDERSEFHLTLRLVNGLRPGAAAAGTGYGLLLNRPAQRAGFGPDARARCTVSGSRGELSLPPAEDYFTIPMATVPAGGDRPPGPARRGRAADSLQEPTEWKTRRRTGSAGS
ncbi:MAG: hypothetical protein M3Q71_12755, partial [Chloroflexota bacterium]|nr:hypothetical protein [Chloroflexota bacterium]